MRVFYPPPCHFVNKKRNILTTYGGKYGKIAHMKHIYAFVVLSMAATASAVASQTNVPPAEIAETSSKLKANAGADFRVRQEIMHNVPGLPGAPGAMLPRSKKEAINQFRFRPRVWGRLDYENFGLYTRLVNETREYVVENGQRHADRNYTFPDEVVVDNLYFEGMGLFDGFLDFRFGRQDLFDGKHSVLGLDHIMQDGAPYVGSRSCYADMARFTLHPTEDSKLDMFALYDNGRNVLRWGNHNSDNRPMNALNPRDSPGMDEWGGGAVWASDLFEKRLPYQIYAVHKHTESYWARWTPAPTRMAEKQITTLGVRVQPQVTESFSFDFEGAKQFGSKSNGGKQAGGWMGYAAMDLHPQISKEWQPYARLSAYYLSGDRHRTDDENDNDTAWDPMWARSPNDSELFQYGTVYGPGYWSNMLYTKLTLGADFGPHHGLCAYSGPMWAAVNDHIGQVGATGGSSYKGWNSSIRYDFPVWLAPKGAKGMDRFEVFGHVVAEMFNPGDYYDSTRPAYFLRWEFIFKF